VSVDWSDEVVFNGFKPDLSVTLERAGDWYVSEWHGGGAYTGATLQITDANGDPVGSGESVVVELS